MLKIKNDIVKLLVSFFLIVGSVEIYSRILSYDDMGDIKNIYKYKYIDVNSLDVICLGSSGLFTSFSPNLAWKLGGFTSYDYGSSGMPISVFQYLLKETRKTQSPKLYVIDIETVINNDEEQKLTKETQRVYDALPFSLNKIISSIKLFGKDSDSLMFYSLGENHYNYSHIIYNCYSPLEDMQQTELLYGSMLLDDKISIDKPCINAVDESLKEPIDSVANECLEDLLNYCKKEKLNVLFVLTPYVFYEGDDSYSIYKKTNYCKDIINKYGFELINYSTNMSQYGIINKDDFADPGHMNACGQRKYTEILTKEILNRIEVDEKDDEMINKWNNNYSYYEEVYSQIEQKINFADQTVDN